MVELTVRLVVSLAVVVGLLMVLARFGGRRFRGAAGALVQVVHRQPLSRTSSIAVVSVGQRVLLLGATEQQVTLLAELDPDDVLTEDEDGADPVPLGLGPAVVPAEPVIRVVRGSHRAAPARPQAAGALAGSVLSPATWRQALAVVRVGRQAP